MATSHPAAIHLLQRQAGLSGKQILNRLQEVVLAKTWRFWQYPRYGVMKVEIR
ncbi:hypothetical protein [Cyanobium usitatum]|jgi:hypothetical protein|uniref:hypothetical protein n=1 Tax=Cyanobium usitatum TaxID=2304190 RepID=UPI002AD4DD64|nr:hypothetical protein [Cyanobium usitatum]